MRVAVVRAEHGRVVESYVFEGRLEDIVKDITRHTIEEWDPAKSDLIITKDFFDITVTGEPDEEVLEELRGMGLVERSESEVKASIPIYYINFDVELDEEAGYIVRRVYVVAPLVSREFKDEIEHEAASLTSPRSSPPPGISEES